MAGSLKLAVGLKMLSFNKVWIWIPLGVPNLSQFLSIEDYIVSRMIMPY